MSKIQSTKNINSPKLIIILALILIIFVGTILLLTKMGKLKSPNQINGITDVFIQTAQAKEIYPMFVCSCCAKSLDPENICCAMAQERITYIDGLTAGKMSKKEVIAAYVKKYGLDAFANKNQAEEFKKELAAKAPDDRPIIFLNLESINLGDVSEAKGEMNTTFEITNTGKSDLIINKLDTSCGCTSTTIVFAGKEGPRFAMTGHGIDSPTDWSVTIPQGQSAQLKVYYNPSVHKDFRGEAVREIYIFSNDPIDFEKKVRIELNQVD